MVFGTKLDKFYSKITNNKLDIKLNFNFYRNFEVSIKPYQ